MSLYQKYRPVSFDEMVGNETQLTALRKALPKQHVFLLIGPPGCGKTTAAKIAARELGAGELSIKEINSSNNRGIETARQIIDQARYSPVEGKATVFIIDEVHMATKDWQNAMLKPLEDVPSHVYYFLCTTNPEKLIAALKSRCMEVKFSLLKPEEIMYLLKSVNRAEGLGISRDLLQDIVDVSEGSPRRALVVLEKVAVLESDEERRKLIISGVPDEENAEAIELARLLLKKAKWQELMTIVNRMEKDDLENVRQVVMGYMGAVLGKAWNAQAMVVLEAFSERDFFYDAKARLLVAMAHSLFE